MPPRKEHTTEQQSAASSTGTYADPSLSLAALSSSGDAQRNTYSGPEWFTAKDIVDFLGCNPGAIPRLCKRANVEPLSAQSNGRKALFYHHADVRKMLAEAYAQRRPLSTGLRRKPVDKPKR